MQPRHLAMIMKLMAYMEGAREDLFEDLKPELMGQIAAIVNGSGFPGALASREVNQFLNDVYVGVVFPMRFVLVDEDYVERMLALMEDQAHVYDSYSITRHLLGPIPQALLDTAFLVFSGHMMDFSDNLRLAMLQILELQEIPRPHDPPGEDIDLVCAYRSVFPCFIEGTMDIQEIGHTAQFLANLDPAYPLRRYENGFPVNLTGNDPEDLQDLFYFTDAQLAAHVRRPPILARINAVRDRHMHAFWNDLQIADALLA